MDESPSFVISSDRAAKRCHISDEEDFNNDCSDSDVNSSDSKRFKASESDDHEESSEESTSTSTEYESVTESNDSQSCVVTMEHQTKSISDPRIVAKLQRKKDAILPVQEALREAKNAFGIDFNFDEFYESLINENYVDETWIVKLKSSINSTDLNDEKILDNDVPERMQQRSPPVTSASPEELVIEAQWIHHHAFERNTITIQDAHLKIKDRATKNPAIISKITIILDLMRNQHLEVPFIAFYRKEQILPELNINDLWTIYQFDAKWCELRRRRDILIKLYRTMKSYQQVNFSNQNSIDDDDLEQLENTQTIDELNDRYRYFMLHYGAEILKSLEEVSSPVYLDTNLISFIQKFGLSSRQFARNLRQERQIYKIERETLLPRMLASNYTNQRFQTAEEVLKSAQLSMAMQIANEPLIRQSLRKFCFDNAKISVRPTDNGIRLIDENHPIYTMKYLREKPVKDLLGEQFLKLSNARIEKLITIDFTNCVEGSYIERMKQLFSEDDEIPNESMREWNCLRINSLLIALKRILIPELKNELHSLLLKEAKDCVRRICRRQIYNWIKIAPYTFDNTNNKELDDDWDSTKGLRVMGVAYTTDLSVASFVCLINPMAECTDYLNLPNLLKLKGSSLENDDLMMKTALVAVKSLIAMKKPHVIAVSGESIDALTIAEEFEKMIASLVEEKNFPKINVEIVDNKAAIVYSNSRRGIDEFPSYPPVLRQAISIARRLQDPLNELSQLMCINDQRDVMLRLKLHALQDQLSNEDLLDDIRMEFVNRVNEVGVDFNKAVKSQYFGNLLQFVSGLGPRKARYLIETLSDQQLENRQQLKTLCQMGDTLFLNCAGFIKIGNEILDRTRVHPQNYDWAGQMATSALDYENVANDHEDALREIIGSLGKLKELDLDVFAMEIEKQGYGNRCVTIYDIRSELISSYKDMRFPYQSPKADQLFEMFIKKSPDDFYVGKLVEATVKKIDNAITWFHLDNGISGSTTAKNSSSDSQKDDKIRVGSKIRCRVSKIDTAKFCIEATCKESDLADENNEWRLPKDPHYDYDTETLLEKKSGKQQQIKNRPAINHRLFRNVNWRDAEIILQTMPQGETIIRPSSKGNEHLCYTWKVTNGIFQHVPVYDKLALGTSLWIGEKEYRNYDDIIVRHINPMITYAAELTNYKYYKGEVMGTTEIAEQVLKEQKRANPNGIPYIVSAAKSCPGKFVLSDLPRDQCRHNFIIVTPIGLKFGGHCFNRLGDLINWFKNHSKEPIPEQTTPIVPNVYRAMLNMQVKRVNPEAMQKLTNNFHHSPYCPPISKKIDRTPYLSQVKKRF